MTRFREADSVAEALFAELEVDHLVESVRGIALDMRYVGQEHFLTIDLGDQSLGKADADDFRGRFIDEYNEAFSVSMDEDVEIVAVRATVRRPLTRRALKRGPQQDGRSDKRETYSFTTDRHTTFEIVALGTLANGSSIAGPAIIIDATTTTNLDGRFVAEVHPSGCLVIADQGAGGR